MASYPPDDRAPNNPVVASIMRERGIGRRRAYALAKQAAAEAVDVSDVSLSQKENVLLSLVTHKSRNAADLKEAMRHDGSEIDGHDVAKMLWACQKMGWVKFRESPKRGIYAIKVTDVGFDHLSKMGREEEEPVPEVATITLEEDGTVEWKPKEVPNELRLDDYPHIQNLLHDFRRQEQLVEAGRLLEQAGEDDIALQVMERTRISDLDRDVVRLVKAVFGEEVS